MRTILVLSPHPGFAETVQAGLDAASVRIIHRLSAEECEPLLVHGLASVCILDADLLGVENIWVIERLRRFNAKIPLIAFSEKNSPEWEEEAFLRGVTHVLPKPVRARLLNSVLERLWLSPVVGHAAEAGTTSLYRSPSEPANTARPVNVAQTLEVIRNFSPILTHSLNAEGMLKQFLQFLREMLSVNRAAIFLNRPGVPLTENISPEDSRRLRSVAAIGLTGGLLDACPARQR